MKKIMVGLIVCFLMFVSTISYADEINIICENKPLQLDVAPIVQDGRTLVPVRGVLEKLGMEVTWFEDEQTVAITGGRLGVGYKIGHNIATLMYDGEATFHQIDVPAQLINDKTYVPLRSISELFGYYIDWIESTNTVLVGRLKLPETPTNKIFTGYGGVELSDIKINELADSIYPGEKVFDYTISGKIIPHISAGTSYNPNTYLSLRVNCYDKDGNSLGSVSILESVSKDKDFKVTLRTLIPSNTYSIDFVAN